MHVAHQHGLDGGRPVPGSPPVDAVYDDGVLVVRRPLIGPGHGDVGARVHQRLVQDLHQLGTPLIVGIGEPDELATAVGESHVPRPGDTCVARGRERVPLASSRAAKSFRSAGVESEDASS